MCLLIETLIFVGIHFLGGISGIGDVYQHEVMLR